MFSFLVQLGESGGSMIFWVKSYYVKGQAPVFSVASINIIPLGINAIIIVFTLLNSWISDSLPGAVRWPGILFSCAMGIIIPVALAATPVHPTVRATRWIFYYLTGLINTSAGLAWTWVNGVNREDPEKRAYVSALMNGFAFIHTAWVPIFTFPSNEQPYIVTGNYVTAGFTLSGAITVLFIRHLQNRDLKGQHKQRATMPADNESL